MIADRPNVNYAASERRDSLLPPVEILKQYEGLQAGEDLINLVKSEQKHRHYLQNKYSNSHRLGQIFSFAVSTYFIYEIFGLIKLDYIREAYILSGIFSAMVLGVTLVLRANKEGALAKKKLTESLAPRRFPHRNSDRR
ncbi:MAG: hypothetical protein LBP39_01210 [Rickettsiales bacterium]|jgi:uncharacterized membrane protein|nr:hypothetical protein [Rickettsiales bacterium]